MDPNRVCLDWAQGPAHLLRDTVCASSPKDIGQIVPKLITEIPVGPVVSAGPSAGKQTHALAWGRKAVVACRAPVEVRPFH